MGANDGILSTASLIAGVAAGTQDGAVVLLAGLAGMVAGALSMAAGEFVSVSSQADAERADVAQERRELHLNPEAELEELTAIYRARGLSHDLARQVAEDLTKADALSAHLRDEIGLTDLSPPRPVQAALVSAGTFAAGAAVPLGVAAVGPPAEALVWLVVATLSALGALGAVGARLGGASPARAAARVMVWGALAMAATSAIGAAVGRGL